MPRRAQNHFIERHSHVEELRHHIQHVLHAGVHAADVQVSGNRIGNKTLLDCGNGLAKKQAATAVTNVEDDSALSGLEQILVDLTGVVEHRHGAEVGVSVNIAWPQLL